MLFAAIELVITLSCNVLSVPCPEKAVLSLVLILDFLPVWFSHSPGIFMTEQVRAWKKVTGAVHAKGAYIFCRIWHVGRASHYIHQPNWQKPLSSTGKAIQPPFLVRLSEGEMARFSDPRALAAHEIPLIVQQFQHAAKNGIAAGFDGVELHAAHGYLVDQFLKDGINDRTDEYGSSVENRCQFLLEFVAAIVENVIIINMIN
ncbi:12-oxophytodienoate reductase 7 isoform X3 [Physcomitrium patens]|uniref:12-oxophytodienoate reductase 7 isoform X3 n=1 Tax=Physcomitrium patens TaxID=3218 RepID=UPI000D17B98A|nr:12-oxophytodienoate reductase 7-like isoform X3 [Physcomitrium patens]|eukprot:XP_024357193.1 12-oxophytodienoate reductase 7-like isoform X3 [Physcomitrella patens]